jgi:hypothetical protein
MSEDDILSLLEIAKDTQRERVAAAGARYEALMVANAISIATRWIRLHAAAEIAERDRLATLFPGASGSLRDLRSKLAAEVRDPSARTGEMRTERILEHLRLTAAGAVAITNPRAAEGATDG